MGHMRGRRSVGNGHAGNAGLSIHLPNLVVPRIAPPGSDGFMQGYERNIIIALMNLIKAERVVEIGVQRGQCARLLLDHVPTITLYWGIDVAPGHRTSLAVQQSEVPAKPGELALSDPRFRLFLGQHGSRSIPEGYIETCDAMIIDGDHSTDGVAHDTMLAESAVRPGGLILWHDYAPPLFKNDVNDFIDGLRAGGRDIRHIPDTWLALEIR